MRRYVFATLVSIVAWVGLQFSVSAEEKTISYKGITLNANLEFASDKKITDDVILLTHGTLAHRGMEIISYLQTLFKERGYNTLAINLSLGIDNRHDMYDCKTPHRHRNEDAADEIHAWIDWLKTQGVKQISLLGHSRGGAQTALYAAERDVSSVATVILLAPAIAENINASAYQQRYNKPLQPILEKAKKLVAEGKGSSMMEHTDFQYCSDTSVSAESFVSYYDNDYRLDSLALIPKISKPTLVVVASDDEVVVGLDKKLAPMVDEKKLFMQVIDHADHFFRDLNADEAVEAIDAFLKQSGKNG